MPTPLFIKRAVVDLVDERGKSLDDAFAIAIASFQKNGYLKPGTSDELTAKGKEAIKDHKAREKKDPKFDRYEQILKQNRKSEALGESRLEQHLLRSASKRVSREGYLAFEDTVGTQPVHGTLIERIMLFIGESKSGPGRESAVESADH